MLVVLALTVLALLLYAAPDVPGVRALHRLLVVAPARSLSRLSPAKILFVLGLGLAAWVLIGLFAGEGLKLFSLMAPDTVLWFAMFDVATLVDAVLFGLVAASSVRLKTVVAKAHSLVERTRAGLSLIASQRPRNRARADRPGKQPDRSSPPRSDDPAPTWAPTWPQGLALAA